MTRKRNLTLLPHAILKRRTLCQAELARAFPGKSKHHHKKKCLHRFTKNEALRLLALLAQLIPKICHRFGFGQGRVPLSLDWTPLRAQKQALFASSLWRAGACLFSSGPPPFAQIRSGPSQNALEEAFVRRLLLALSFAVWPVLLADRGFGRVSFLLFLERVRKALGRGVSFVIRLASKVMVEQGGKKPMARREDYCTGREWDETGYVPVGCPIETAP